MELKRAFSQLSEPVYTKEIILNLLDNLDDSIKKNLTLIPINSKANDMLAEVEKRLNELEESELKSFIQILSKQEKELNLIKDLEDFKKRESEFLKYLYNLLVKKK